MRQRPSSNLTTPLLLPQANELAQYLRSLSVVQLQKAMKLSPSLAQKTHDLIGRWNDHPNEQTAAMDSFIGDIYSGLQAGQFTSADRDYAQQHLRILSGLYGILRPLDGIFPYRLELGYRLPAAPYQNLYHFWGSKIAETLPPDEPIINLASVEYSKTVLPFVDPTRVITPIFLTIDPKTTTPTFVTVHAKIARGAFARWMIVNRIDNPGALIQFDDIGYHYVPNLSSQIEPVFVCRDFKGKGLSMRLER